MGWLHRPVSQEVGTHICPQVPQHRQPGQKEALYLAMGEEAGKEHEGEAGSQSFSLSPQMETHLGAFICLDKVNCFNQLDRK